MAPYTDAELTDAGLTEVEAYPTGNLIQLGYGVQDRASTLPTGR